jgi:signal transduction histidine kinase
MALLRHPGAIFLAAVVGLAVVCPDGRATEVSALTTSATVDGKPVAVGEELRLTLPFRSLDFVVQPLKPAETDPYRISHRLVGLSDEWSEHPSGMSVTARFFGAERVVVGQKDFSILGVSAGWKGTIAQSQFTHRKETLPVPPGAVTMNITISSAGSPASIGVLVVKNLTVDLNSPDHSLERIYPPKMLAPDMTSSSSIAEMWMKNGTHPSMACLVREGGDASPFGFCVKDTDPLSHAEWTLRTEYQLPVASGGEVVMEWDEVYTIGDYAPARVHFDRLPPGSYDFEARALDLYGMPLPVGQKIKITVVRPIWQNARLWGGSAGALGALALGIAYWRVRKRAVRKEMERLSRKHLMESERVRIAQNIHDDLGARMTHLSLVSDKFGDDVKMSAEAKEGFSAVSGLTREMVAALHEAIWMVNPENDDLRSFIDYLCELIPQMCGPAGVRCWIQTPDDELNPELSSEVRHQLVMIVKEAVNNSLKHARCKNLRIDLEYEAPRLKLEISDNGVGFGPGSETSGRGLKNLASRVEKLKGAFAISSELGQGTRISFSLDLK